jgi:hypothetical protein
MQSVSSPGASYISGVEHNVYFLNVEYFNINIIYLLAENLCKALDYLQKCMEKKQSLITVLTILFRWFMVLELVNKKVKQKI